MSNRIIVTIIINLLAALNLNAVTDIFVYTTTHDNGRGGLRVAYRRHPDSSWTLINNGNRIMRSDFGSLKSMHNPRITHHDNTLTALWDLDKEGTARATTSSHDMYLWTPQHYGTSSDSIIARAIMATSSAKPSTQLIANDSITGYISSVPDSVIDNYFAAVDNASWYFKGRGDRLGNDSVKFATLEPITATIDIDAKAPKSVSDKLIGIFFEDINYSADGGLYAELIQNRDFEYSAHDGNRDPNWNATYSWILPGGDTRCEILDTLPIHPNNPHYLSITTGSNKAKIMNTGYDGIPVKANARYDLSITGRSSAHKPVKVAASLVTPAGKTLASSKFTIKPGDWHKHALTLTPTGRCDSCHLVITIPAHSHIDLDMVSLFPHDTFKDRPNGMRADLAQVIADIHPRFMRFPGGCLVHGDGLDNIYNWKETVGPIETRRPDANIWRYHQSRGLGYYEYFRFCEDIGAEPLPVVAAGVSCQNSGIAGPSQHSHDLVTSYGQMGGIPLEQMPRYIDDILDLIEWANGDSTTTWGRVRARAGHPAPFNLKYLAIGNEDLISDVFTRRFTMIYNAVRQRYPDIKIIGTSGPAVEGSDYEAGWQLARDLGIDLVDEHNYNTPGWYLNNTHFYDTYPTHGPKVYLGEYAVHHPRRISTIETALVNALFLTLVERNSDVVLMTSYAPLLARHGHTQWTPNLIYFDGTRVYPTLDYEVQRIFGNAAGDTYLPTTLALDQIPTDALDRIGVSTLIDSTTGDTFIKVVNLLPVEFNATITGLDIPGSTRITRHTLSGNPDDTEATTITTTVTPGRLQHATYPPYSLTVYQLESVWNCASQL